MATEPITLFAKTPDPARVVEVLRRLEVKFNVDGQDDSWSEIVVTTGPWLRKRRLKITHDPAYYSGIDWKIQMNGMCGYFSQFPDIPEREKVFALTHQFGFALGTLLDPDAVADDERLDIISTIADALDAVWFTPSSIRDSFGRVLYGADPSELDPEAQWPSYL